MFITYKNWFSLISEYLVYFFIVVFPFLNYSGSFLYFGTSTRSINLIVASSFWAILLGVFLLKKEVSIKLPKSFVLLSLALYFVSMCISAVLGGDFHTSFYSYITRTTGLWYFICLGIFLLLLINVFKDTLKRNIAITIFVVSSACFAVLSMLGPEGFGVLFSTYQGDGFTLGNSTFAGMYIFAAFILSLYLIISSKKMLWWKIILPIIILFNPFIINMGSNEASGPLWFLGESKASGLVVIFSSVFILFLWLISKINHTKTKKTIAYSCFILTFFVAAFLVNSLFLEGGFVRNFYLSQSSGARLLVWESANKVIQEKPYFGWGTDNFTKAFERNYDNRLLQDKYGNEAWFDRAHNIFIDQLVDNGFIGLTFYILVYIVSVLSLLYVIFNSKSEDNKKLAFVLTAYVPFHLLELQTAFDTSVSYFPVIIVLALIVVIHSETLHENNSKFDLALPVIVKYIFSGLLIIFGVWSIFFNALPFINSQIVNGKIRAVGSSEERIKLYPALFNTPVDVQAILWRTLTDFQRGIGEHPEILSDPKKIDLLKKELSIFEEQYAVYLQNNPDDFRALLSYADIKIYFMLFGVDKLEEAQTILDKAIVLVPEAPHPYWMKAVAYLYMEKFELARKWAKDGLALNPEAVTSREVVEYIDKSIKTFPEIELYFFRQI